MRNIVQSNDNSGNGNGQKDYDPEVEFEYLDADVWFKDTAEGREVAYTEDVLKELEDDEESSSN